MKKILTVVIAAVAFGVLAGGTMVGVNVAAHKAIPELQQQAEVQQTQSNADKTADAGAASKAAPAVTTGTNLDVSDIVENAMPQVVSITNTMLIKSQGYSSIFDYFYGGGPQEQEYEGQASGSGVILKKTDSELLVVTNNHVVKDSKELSVTFVDGTTVDAAIKGTDSTIDLAVVAVPLKNIPQETLNKIKVSTLHDQDDLKVGQGVIAIGNALGFGQSVTVGYISALNREIQTEEGTNSNLIQVDAAINPGNSGGALLNMQGEVIGINVAKLANTEVEGIGYAIPIYKAVSVIDNLSNVKTKVAVPEDQQGRLGVYMKTITPEYSQNLGLPQGVLITGFSDEKMDGFEGQQEPSPAKEAGLQKNDVITKFDGQGVESAEDLQKLVTYYEAGSKVQITYKRLENGEWQEKTAEVTLAKKSAQLNGQAGANGGNQSGAPDLGVPDNGLNQQGGQEQQNGGSEGQPQDGSDNGNGQDGSQNGGQSGSQDNLYDLFRQFMEGQGQGQGQGGQQ